MKNNSKYFYVYSRDEADKLGHASKQRYMKFTNKEGQVFYSFVKTKHLIEVYRALRTLKMVS